MFGGPLVIRRKDRSYERVRFPASPGCGQRRRDSTAAARAGGVDACRRQQHSLCAGLRHADRPALGRPAGREQAHGGQDQDQKAADLYYGARRLRLWRPAGHRAYHERHARYRRRQECRDGGRFGLVDAKDHDRLRGHHAGRGRFRQGAALRGFHYRYIERQPEQYAFAVCRRVEQLGQRRLGRGARYRGPHSHQQPRGRRLRPVRGDHGRRHHLRGRIRGQRCLERPRRY